MERFKEWLRHQWGPGTKYRSPRQLSLAISDDKDEGAYAAMERRGLVKFDRAKGLAKATGVSVLQILLMAELVSETEIESISGQILTTGQVQAADLYQAMPDDFAEAWLESGEKLRQLAQGSNGVAEEGPGYQAGPGSQ